MTVAARQYRPSPSEVQARATCGARLPDGRRCLCRPVENPQTGQPRNGRCAAHGGFSTGPRSAEGLARVATAMLRGRGLERAARPTDYETTSEMRAGEHAHRLDHPADQRARSARPAGNPRRR